MLGSKSKAQKGFTIVEIMIAVGILAVVSLSVVYLVTDTFRRTVEIADSGRCNEVLNAAFATLDAFGSTLDPLPPSFDPQFSGSTPTPNGTTEAFVSNWTPLPLSENIGGRVRLNNFQLLRSPIAALLSIYNTEGSANLLQGGYDYPRTENLIINQFGSLDRRNAEFRIGITPVDANGNAQNIPSPLGIVPMKGPLPNLSNSVSWRSDLGMRLTLVLNFTTAGGQPSSCSLSKNYYFQTDPTMVTPDFTNAITVHVGDLDTTNPHTPNTPQEARMQLIPYQVNEYYGCQSDQVTIRLNTQLARIEPASLVMCRAQIQDDPSTPAVNETTDLGFAPTGWIRCADVTLGGAVQTWVNSGIFTYHVSNAITDVTYEFDFAVVDGGGNTFEHKTTFSIDVTRPRITSFTEQTNLFNIPAANLTRRLSTWPIPPNTQTQCSIGNPTFRARIEGSLLNKTGVFETGALAISHPNDPNLALSANILCDLADSTTGLIPTNANITPIFAVPAPPNNDVIGYFCDITATDLNPNGLRSIVLHTGDLCGVDNDATPRPGPISAVPANQFSRYDFEYMDLTTKPSISSNTRDPGNPTIRGDESILATLSNAADNFTALYCQCSNTEDTSAAFQCSVEPGTSALGPGTNICDDGTGNNDTRGQVVGYVYDICTPMAVAQTVANRQFNMYYCDQPNSYYTREVCEHHLGAGNCVEIGNSNCWEQSTVTPTTVPTPTTGPVGLLNCDEESHTWGDVANCRHRYWCESDRNQPCCGTVGEYHDGNNWNWCPGGNGNYCGSNSPNNCSSVGGYNSKATCESNLTPGRDKECYSDSNINGGCWFRCGFNVLHGESPPTCLNRGQPCTRSNTDYPNYGNCCDPAQTTSGGGNVCPMNDNICQPCIPRGERTPHPSACCDIPDRSIGGFGYCGCIKDGEPCGGFSESVCCSGHATAMNFGVCLPNAVCTPQPVSGYCKGGTNVNRACSSNTDCPPGCGVDPQSYCHLNDPNIVSRCP